MDKTKQKAMKKVLAKDVAEKELEQWFDYRRMKESARNNADEDGNDIFKEKIVEAFQYGELVFKPETGELIQNLSVPVKKESGEIILEKLVYQPRVKRNALTEPMKGVKLNDTEGRTKAWISAVTGVNKSHLGLMDLSDFGISEAIITYFLK